MIYKLIIIIALTLFCPISANAQLNKSILKNIYGQQKGKKDVLKTANRFDLTRQKLNEIDSLSFINQKMDTIYFLEMYDMETGISYGSIWNKRKILNYTYYYGGTIEFKTTSFFSCYMRKLVSVWDIDEIRKEEQRSKGIIFRNNIFATRLIIEKKNKIDVISFDEFFDFERDKE